MACEFSLTKIMHEFFTVGDDFDNYYSIRWTSISSMEIQPVVSSVQIEESGVVPIDGYLQGSFPGTRLETKYELRIHRENGCPFILKFNEKKAVIGLMKNITLGLNIKFSDGRYAPDSYAEVRDHSKKVLKNSLPSEAQIPKPYSYAQ